MTKGGRLAGLKHRKAPHDQADRLKALQQRLAELQVVCHRQRRAAIIMVEGWDAAGKGGLIKRMTAELDPRYFEVVPISAPRGRERHEHYLTRFWKRMPLAGNWTIFDRSWYGRVLVERVEGFATTAEWQRAYDEINAIEAMHIAHGTCIIKLFLHVDQDEQDRRLIDRLQQPWKRWKVSEEDFRNRARRDDYLQAMEDMFQRTDSKDAPWHIIAANHKKFARIAGLTIVADRLANGMDMSDPPLAPEIRRLAAETFGKDALPPA